MAMKQIRGKYGVPAKRGMIVQVGKYLTGKIVGSHGLYLRIKIFDPDTGWHKCCGLYHPTWDITYPKIT